MRRVSVREGNLPEKIRVFVISPALMSGQIEPPEVYECKPDELVEYADENSAVTQPLRPKLIDISKDGNGREDAHWYIAAYAEEEFQEGRVVKVRKVLYAEVTPEWLRTTGRRRLKQRKAIEEGGKIAPDITRNPRLSKIKPSGAQGPTD